jgi:RimJ/RimL family protein N-acetyltransferase
VELPRPQPARAALEGRYCRLEPLEPDHATGLYENCRAPELYDWLFEIPPRDAADMRAWVDKVSSISDPFYFAVIDRASGKVAGRQALMRITPEHGVIEIGSICWGTGAARTRVATEALYLFASYAFDDLGYRRFEWKCNNDNAPSKAAARRFGFTYEGLFRQHMWAKGANRDTAWFSMIDGEWPRLKAAHERWLAPANFDPTGIQRSKLEVAAR